MYSCVDDQQELEALVEVDVPGHEAARSSPLPARLGAAVNPGSQGQLSRSDAHSFSYSLAPLTKGSERIVFLSDFVCTELLETV